MGNRHLIFERYLWFHAEIKKGRYPNAPKLAKKYGITERTAARNIAFMRDFLEAPLRYVPARRGYTYDTEFSLPDLPISQAELLAVLLAQNLITSTDTGYIGKAIKKFGRKLFQRNSHMGISQASLEQRFSASWHGYSPCNSRIFQKVVLGLLTDRCLQLAYLSPLRNRRTERVIEPYHLRHYMGSWVLLAWCRLRNDWRQFYLARMVQLELLNDSFVRKPPSEWRPLLENAFGIFQGHGLFRVKIRFTPYMARWVRNQVWHPDQQKEELEDGGMILTIPAADLREIKMQVMRFGAEAQVLEPEALRCLIHDEIQKMAIKYA